MPNLPSVVVMSGARNKKKNERWIRLENRLNRFLIIWMSNVSSAVVISGAENGKLQRIRWIENKSVRLSKIDVKLTVCVGYLWC